MDNGTMMEAFKSLNYYQLAKTSLVSKRFRDLIRTNRHRLALLYVSNISMDISPGSLLVTEIFNKRLSPEEYNEWVIRNQYSKQIPLEKFEMAGIQTMQHERRMYQLCANAGRELWNPRVVFFARAELNHENWPLFEHFTRFLTDPFVYLGHVSFDWTTQKEFFNLLINPDTDRLQCHSMKLSIRDTDLDFPNLVTWVKCHLLCDELKIEKELEIYNLFNDDDLNHDETLLDFIMTGGHCTSALIITNYGLTNVLDGLAKKFMDFKEGDECNVVHSIKGDIHPDAVEVFKSHLGEFLVKEKRDVHKIYWERKEIVFEFVNKDINQKCQFIATYF